MPIYEYESLDQKNSCPTCARPFEVLQGIQDPPLRVCPDCGKPLRKLISWCRAAVMDVPEEHAGTKGPSIGTDVLVELQSIAQTGKGYLLSWYVCFHVRKIERNNR